MELENIEKQFRDYFVTSFDKQEESHVSLLKRLWSASKLDGDDSRNTNNFQLKCELWKNLGFQRDDPVSDFRATGLLGLQNLIYFSETYPDLFHQMALNQLQSSEMEYPFATVGINITYALISLLCLKKEETWFPQLQTYPLFFYNRKAWEDLYVIIFRLFDQKWNQMMVGYMGFQKVMDATKESVEELVSKKCNLGVPAIFDMLSILLEDLKSFRTDQSKKEEKSYMQFSKSVSTPNAIHVTNISSNNLVNENINNSNSNNNNNNNNNKNDNNNNGNNNGNNNKNEFQRSSTFSKSGGYKDGWVAMSPLSNRDRARTAFGSRTVSLNINTFAKENKPENNILSDQDANSNHINDDDNNNKKVNNENDNLQNENINEIVESNVINDRANQEIVNTLENDQKNELISNIDISNQNLKLETVNIVNHNSESNNVTSKSVSPRDENGKGLKRRKSLKDIGRAFVKK